jgi:hypothetical protein
VFQVLARSLDADGSSDSYLYAAHTYPRLLDDHTIAHKGASTGDVESEHRDLD